MTGSDRSRDRWMGGAGLALLGLIIGLLAWLAPPQGGASDERSRAAAADRRPVAEEAPELTWEWMGGETGRLSDHRGRPVLLHFWASWCPSCRHELPSLLTYAGDAPVDVVAVSLDRAWDPVAPLIGGPRRDVVRSSPDEAARAFGTRSLPETWVIDADGRVRGRLAGAADWSSPAVRAAVDRALSGSLGQAADGLVPLPSEGDCELDRDAAECG